jgi:hypothetical protein
MDNASRAKIADTLAKANSLSDDTLSKVAELRATIKADTAKAIADMRVDAEAFLKVEMEKLDVRLTKWAHDQDEAAKPLWRRKPPLG